jgi:GNAT superfamily N-acetyltransferase
MGMIALPAAPATPIGRFHVWRRGDPLPNLPDIPHLSIVPVDDWQRATALTGMDAAETRCRLREGHRLWLAYVAGEAVGWGWSATESFSIGELGIARRLPSGDRYLWDFFTVPSWRGHRIYPHLLQAIVSRETEAERFWLGHDLDNEASRHGIARAGFQEVGTLYRDPRGAFVLVPAASLDVASAAGKLFAVSVAQPGDSHPLDAT